MAIWACYQATGQSRGSLAVLTLWTSGLAVLRGSQLLNLLFAAPDLPALINLPAANALIFRWQLQKFVFDSLFSCLDILTGLMVLAFACGLPPGGFAILVPLTLVVSLVLASVAASLAIQLPTFTRIVAGLAGLTWFFVFIFGRLVPWPKMWGLLDRQAVWINSLLPTGWPVSLFQLLQPAPEWWVLVLFAPMGLLIYSLKKSLARLEANYVLQDVSVPESKDIHPAANMAGQPVSDLGVARVGVTEIEQLVESRQFLLAPVWHTRGWLERWLWNWLTVRERALAEFVFEQGLRYSASWKKISRNLLVGTTVGYALGLVSPVAKLCVIGLTVFITVCQALAEILGTGRAFAKMPCCGVMLPLYAAYPVGFRELSGLLFKCTLVQLICLVPFVLATTFLVIFAFDVPGFSLLDSAVFGLKASCLIAAARFGAVILSFSSGTNDTATFRLRSFALWVSVMILGFLFVALGGAALFVPAGVISWLLLLLAVIAGYTLFRIYGWFYHANRFDLMNIPRQ